MATKKKTEEKTETPKATSEPRTITGEVAEVSVPEGQEPEPGVDTTAEGLAKKYKQPVPEGVKEVLGDSVNPEPVGQVAEARTTKGETGDTANKDGETASTPSAPLEPVAPVAPATTRTATTATTSRRGQASGTNKAGNGKKK